jgi:CheY-like chemotaxis protein
MEGHVVRTAPDGEAALALARTFDPELVLLDLGLPRMDGYQVARALREVLGRRVPLIALTGYQADPARLRAAGFDGHLLKPTSLGRLFALVAELGTRAVAPETG